jgi:hypothetical protein
MINTFLARLSLCLAIFVIILPTYTLSKRPQKNSYTADKKTVPHKGIIQAVQQKRSVRLLPPCPPAPSMPGAAVVPTQNALALAVTFFPNNSASNSAAPAPQTIGVHFTAGSLATFPSFLGSVPGTMGVAGPTQYVMGINGGLVSFEKNGTPDGFLYTENASFLDLDGDFSLFVDYSNGQLRYDSFTDRYYYTILNFDSNGNAYPNGFSIAVSDSGQITNATTWTVVNVFNTSVLPNEIGCGGDQNQFLDYGVMAIDQHALYISFNLFFEGTELFTSNSILVIQKESLLQDGPAFISAFYDVSGYPGSLLPTNPIREATSSLTPVDNFDSDPEFGYIIGQSTTEFGSLVMYRVSNPGTTSPTLSLPIFIDVPTTGSNMLLQVPFQGNLFGTLGQLGGIDDRIIQAHIRNNQLYAVHTIPVTAAGVGSPSGDRYGQRWYQFNVATVTPTLVQAGTLWDQSPNNTLHYIYGSIMTNARGDLAISGTVAGPTLEPSAFVVGRLTSDPLGTLRVGAVVNDIIYAQGLGAFSQYLGTARGGGGQRWGDYSHMSLDPEDNATMWTIQQVTDNGLYRLVAAQLLAP